MQIEEKIDIILNIYFDDYNKFTKIIKSGSNIIFEITEYFM